MYIEDIGYMGSLIQCLPEPTSQYLNGGYISKEWKFTTKTNDHYILIKKEVPNFEDYIFYILDKFYPLFDTYIVDNSKRLAVIINKQKNKLMLPTTISLCALYLILKAYGREKEFEDKIRQIVPIINELRNMRKVNSLNSYIVRVRVHSRDLELLIKSDMDRIVNLRGLYV